jgi:toxin ParE1/3/4
MITQVVLIPEAEADLAEAAKWYEQRLDGLGRELVICIRETLQPLSSLPDHHEEVIPEIRRKMVKRFPYSIFYRSHENRIEVLGIFHNHRDPKAWERCLKRN